MADEKTYSAQSSQTEPIALSSRVLLIDSDSDSLAALTVMLEHFGYKVTAATEGYQALCILQEKEDGLDFILADSNLADMDKYEFLELAGGVSSLPILILSADGSEREVLGCLYKGATFYVLKPMTESKAKALWQFSRKFSFVKTSIEGVNSEEEAPMQEDELVEHQTVVDISNLKGKRQRKRTDDDNAAGISPLIVTKKRKLVWTPELKCRFLEAAWAFGVDDAQPKKILKHMNVSGLKNKQVSNHLQKYRKSVRDERKEVQKTLTVADNPLLTIDVQRKVEDFLNSIPLDIAPELEVVDNIDIILCGLVAPRCVCTSLLQQFPGQSNFYGMQQNGPSAPSDNEIMNRNDMLPPSSNQVGNGNVEEQGSDISCMEIDRPAALGNSQQQQQQQQQQEELPPPPEQENEDENMPDNGSLELENLFDLPAGFYSDLNDSLP